MFPVVRDSLECFVGWLDFKSLNTFRNLGLGANIKSGLASPFFSTLGELGEKIMQFKCTSA